MSERTNKRKKEINKEEREKNWVVFLGDTVRAASFQFYLHYKK